MTLRPLIAGTALLAATVGVMATAASAMPGPTSDTSTAGSNVPTRPNPMQRRFDRLRPGVPLKPRVIEAPGAAVMMIPANYEPATGPFSPI